MGANREKLLREVLSPDSKESLWGCLKACNPKRLFAFCFFSSENWSETYLAVKWPLQKRATSIRLSRIDLWRERRTEWLIVCVFKTFRNGQRNGTHMISGRSFALFKRVRQACPSPMTSESLVVTGLSSTSAEFLLQMLTKRGLSFVGLY